MGPDVCLPQSIPYQQLCLSTSTGTGIVHASVFRGRLKNSCFEKTQLEQGSKRKVSKYLHMPLNVPVLALHAIKMYLDI